jgi:hypothetical protein
VELSLARQLQLSSDWSSSSSSSLLLPPAAAAAGSTKAPQVHLNVYTSLPAAAAAAAAAAARTHESQLDCAEARVSSLTSQFHIAAADVQPDQQLPARMAC